MAEGAVSTAVLLEKSIWWKMATEYGNYGGSGTVPTAVLLEKSIACNMAAQ